jgi:hypothetical protein
VRRQRRFHLLATLAVACSALGTPLTEVVESRTLLPGARLAELAASAPERGTFAFGDAYWDPSAEELTACEEQLRAHWGSRRYDVQYFGTTKRGERVLHVRGWCAGRNTSAELASFPVATFDAGRCHFVAKCRPRTWPRASVSFSAARGK